MNGRVSIRSYTKVWKIENKIYAIQNFVLPVPISPRAVAFFILIAGTMLLISAIIPAVGKIPVVLRLGALPFGMTQFLLKKKLDGKMPHKYFVAWIKHVSSRDAYIERFCSYPGGRDATYRLSWQTGRGNWR